MVSEAQEGKKKNNFTVLGWLNEYLLLSLARLIEVLFRLILLCLPLWVYLVIIQLRQKVSTIRNISVYTNDTSVWQHIFPGFILVAVDPKALQKIVSQKRKAFDNFVEDNKYFIVLIVLGILFTFLFLHT